MEIQLFKEQLRALGVLRNGMELRFKLLERGSVTIDLEDEVLLVANFSVDIVFNRSFRRRQVHRSVQTLFPAMDVVDLPLDILSMTSFLLLLILNTHRSLAFESTVPDVDNSDFEVQLPCILSASSSSEADASASVVLHLFRLWSSLNFVDSELDFWVKPRSTAWFSCFFLQEYDEDRWIQMFRMTKKCLFSLARLLSPCIQKRNTNYRSAVPVPVRLACCLFKLSHGVSLLICSEMFAVGQSTVSIMLREVVHAVNSVLRSEISWPVGEKAISTAVAFQSLCGLPWVLGAIDGTHIAIAKPRHAASDYYYFKSGGYSINCQAVFDSFKRFVDLHVGMSGSTNDSRVLRRSTLFHKRQHRTLWDRGLLFSGFSSYLLGDAGYPLLPWLMVPHRQQGGLAVADVVFNRRLSRGRGVVKNAFALLKLNFRKLHKKSDLHVTILSDVVLCCCILHNLLLKQSAEEMQRLLRVLGTEDQGRQSIDEADAPVQPVEHAGDDVAAEEGRMKRRELRMFLDLQRIAPF